MVFTPCLIHQRIHLLIIVRNNHVGQLNFVPAQLRKMASDDQGGQVPKLLFNTILTVIHFNQEDPSGPTHPNLCSWRT
jgi:hypothetical protein